MDDMNRLVATNVRAARRASGLTQGELADRMESAGVKWTRAIVSNVENGHRPITVNEVAALSIVLETTPGWFFAPPADANTDVKVGVHVLRGPFLIAAAAAGDAALVDPRFSSWARLYEALSRAVTEGGITSEDARLMASVLARVRAASEFPEAEG